MITDTTSLWTYRDADTMVEMVYQLWNSIKIKNLAVASIGYFFLLNRRSVTFGNNFIEFDGTTGTSYCQTGLWSTEWTLE